MGQEDGVYKAHTATGIALLDERGQTSDCILSVDVIAVTSRQI